MSIVDEIKSYAPCCEQEARDKAVILDFLGNHTDAFFRSNLIAHMTASSWIVNPARTKVVMVYHRIYDSWSWSGGHADGETDLLSVALREAREETGLRHVRAISPEIFSLEALTVDYTHVLVDGRIVAEGGPELVERINEEGFEKYV